MITERDLEILKFINIYGKTYMNVLGKTFFNTEQQARNRINKLYSQKLISYWNTNLITPRRAIVLSTDTRKYFEEELDIKAKKIQLNMTTIAHNINEQITHYWLSNIGEITRTSVAKHGSIMHHVPDMILTLPSGGRIFIEVEMQKKSQPRYTEIMLKVTKDNPDQILYVLPKKDNLANFARFLPVWNKLRFIDIDTLVENISSTGKVSAYLQETFLQY